MLSDISETVRVKLYFGNRQIRYGEEGVDLRQFNLVEKYIKERQKEH
jgi:hypothetical protein